mgnify:FL=1
MLGSSKLVNIRPERIKIAPEKSKVAAGEVAVSGTIIDVAYTGANTLYVIQTDGGARLISTRLNEELPGQDLVFDAGDRVQASFRKELVAEIPN